MSVSLHLRKIIKLNQLQGISCKSFCSGANSSTAQPKQSEPAVPGLSSKVLNVPSTATGPGASKSGIYKNPEYFCYHQTSYFDAEIEMAKYRLPQPSAK